MLRDYREEKQAKECEEGQRITVKSPSFLAEEKELAFAEHSSIVIRRTK
jgi:hypothetical protein